MRVFIAIDIPEESIKEIRKIQALLPKFEGKKTEPNNLHLTLKFLGDVDPRNVRQIRQKLREIKFKIFETEIDSLGVFYPQSIRIIWLHMSNCDGLQNEIDKKLMGMFEPENRFMSHLTIARVKYVKDKDKFLRGLEKIKFGKIKFKVENFKLKKSTITERGSIYEDLESYNLV